MTSRGRRSWRGARGGRVVRQRRCTGHIKRLYRVCDECQRERRMSKGGCVLYFVRDNNTLALHGCCINTALAPSQCQTIQQSSRISPSDCLCACFEPRFSFVRNTKIHSVAIKSVPCLSKDSRRTRRRSPLCTPTETHGSLSRGACMSYTRTSYL